MLTRLIEWSYSLFKDKRTLRTPYCNFSHIPGNLVYRHSLVNACNFDDMEAILDITASS